MPLKEVVDGAGLKEMAGAGRDVQHVEGIFRLLGQVHQLLLQPLYLLLIIIALLLYHFTMRLYIAA